MLHYRSATYCPHAEELAQTPQFGGNKVLQYLKYMILIAVLFCLQMGEHRETQGWLRSGEEMATGPYHFAVFRDSAFPGGHVFKGNCWVKKAQT
jgi:hypothetical protein